MDHRSLPSTALISSPAAPNIAHAAGRIWKPAATAACSSMQGDDAALGGALTLRVLDARPPSAFHAWAQPASSQLQASAHAVGPWLSGQLLGASSSGAALHAGRHIGGASTARDHQIVPPYWSRHKRRGSGGSEAEEENDRPAPIRLEDHTVEGSDQNRALWAKHVTIDDYVIVSGNVPGMGDYVVWNCTVQTLDGGPMKIRKRYVWTYEV
ncbi:hypothetical protein GTA08_BOTSDO13358 [Neofusicoccum parvum]|nr:hypothetical protein GTA08_BOTSDO13358 [Neofusicoccum parvum]